jgi:hypothetical protein
MSDAQPISNSEFSSTTTAIRRTPPSSPPWEILACFAFQEKEKAAAFEKYLKSASGRAFAIRHFY